VVSNSNLNLQLSGKLSENVNILAAITDDNIPIQPDGNTQQIQDFDRIFIKLFNKKRPLIYKIQEGKYIIDLASTLQQSISSIKGIRNPDEKEG